MTSDEKQEAGIRCRVPGVRAGLGIRDTGANQGTASAVTIRQGESRFPSLAPSQCPRHSPTSFIGGRVEEDEGIFLVGGGAAREVAPHPHDKQNLWPPPAGRSPE